MATIVLTVKGGVGNTGRLNTENTQILRRHYYCMINERMNIKHNIFIDNHKVTAVLG